MYTIYNVIHTVYIIYIVSIIFMPYWQSIAYVTYTHANIMLYNILDHTSCFKSPFLYPLTPFEVKLRVRLQRGHFWYLVWCKVSVLNRFLCCLAFVWYPVSRYDTYAFFKSHKHTDSSISCPKEVSNNDLTSQNGTLTTAKSTSTNGCTVSVTPVLWRLMLLYDNRTKHKFVLGLQEFATLHAKHVDWHYLTRSAQNVEFSQTGFMMLCLLQKHPKVLWNACSLNSYLFLSRPNLHVTCQESSQQILPWRFHLEIPLS